MNMAAQSFQYDPLGRRVAKTVLSTTTNYLYDRVNPVQELSGTTPTANLITGGVDESYWAQLLPPGAYTARQLAEIMTNADPCWKRIEHIVVLMLENRSFDNLLGWLYDPQNTPPFNVVPRDFDGLSAKSLSNPDPNGRNIAVGKTLDPRSPQPNPGEPFEHVYSQVYNVPLVDLRNVPPTPPHQPNMQGFIRNYAIQKNAPADPAKIMESMTPKTAPVLSALAHHYAVCDRWFASIPSQTFCNRSFIHAGTSSGYVNNSGGALCFVNDSTTIFDLLEMAGKTWTIFCGSWLLESFTLLTQKHLWKYALGEHFAHLRDFTTAASQKGGLPAYSFLEPIYFDSIVWGPENDMHPECNPYEFYGPSNLERGEALIAKVYDVIRNSPDWESTLLIILFDEHGGCYDHVPPPSAPECEVAIAPDRIISASEPGGSGFKFDRLGPRVPAIIISAYTKPQTRLHCVFEHTSVLSTVVNCFDLPNNRLGKRQAEAPDLKDALNSPRPRKDRPPIPNSQFSFVEDAEAALHSLVHTKLLRFKRRPISDLRRNALHGMAVFTQAGDLISRVEGIENELEANLLLVEHEAKLVWGKTF
jgi:phospholipase C